MAEQYLTKVDLLEHEKDANKRREDTKKDEQRLRHEQTERFQKVINKIDDKINITHDKVESNDKELDLLKQSHSTMTEKVNEIKSEMKE
jgi:Tfp pilus assembly protein PilN